jgi:hypothetical protein
MIKKAHALIILGILLVLQGCNKDIDPVYRQRMRDFVVAISQYSKRLIPVSSSFRKTALNW